ncbi:hypothetical protein EZS27_021927 [termite gut metagenome]|uniref:Uncharacterized protein n=1 Tax=termite gut metagenome TaxID=433724 RepID=A0A5J4R6E1_9ZZZZ
MILKKKYLYIFQTSRREQRQVTNVGAGVARSYDNIAILDPDSGRADPAPTLMGFYFKCTTD